MVIQNQSSSVSLALEFVCPTCVKPNCNSDVLFLAAICLGIPQIIAWAEVEACLAAVMMGWVLVVASTLD